MRTARNIAIAALLVAAFLAYRFWGVSDIAAEAVRLHMRMIGESMYEFHEKTGRWPVRPDDLAETSFPKKTPYWRQDVEGPAFVVLWPKEGMKPDPKANARTVLVYHDKGTLAWFGRKWVCWGDLRTEYVATGKLREQLRNQ
jgi:hypothetical protein